MKTARIFSVLALLLLAGLGLRAQDVVTLKNGSFVRGTITEYIAGDHVRIKTEEGKVYEYPAAEIESTQVGSVMNQGYRVRKPVAVKPKGYYNLTGLSFSFGNDYGLVAGLGLYTENGWQWNKHLMTGVGVGLEYLDFAVRVPITANARFKFLDGPVSPYVGLMTGYTLSGQDPNRYYFEGGPSMARNYGGITTGANVGVLAYCAPHFGINASLGYRYQTFRSTYDEVLWNGNQMTYYPVEERSYLHRIHLGIGFLFN